MANEKDLKWCVEEITVIKNKVDAMSKNFANFYTEITNKLSKLREE